MIRPLKIAFPFYRYEKRQLPILTTLCAGTFVVYRDIITRADLPYIPRLHFLFFFRIERRAFLSFWPCLHQPFKEARECNNELASPLGERNAAESSSLGCESALSAARSSDKCARVLNRATGRHGFMWISISEQLCAPLLSPPFFLSSLPFFPFSTIRFPFSLFRRASVACTQFTVAKFKY